MLISLLRPRARLLAARSFGQILPSKLCGGAIAASFAVARRSYVDATTSQPSAEEGGGRKRVQKMRDEILSGGDASATTQPAAAVADQSPGPKVQTNFDGSAVIVSWRDAKPSRYATAWLRDVCPCDTCVHPSSGQKRFATSQVPFSPPIEKADLLEDGSLAVTWNGDFMSGGGPHESVYTRYYMEGLDRSLPSRAPLPKVRYWNREILEEEIRYIHYDDWVSGGAEFWKAFADLVRMGIVLVRGAPQSESTVEAIGNAIGPLQTTIYGRTWDVISKPEAENVAYTSEFLGLHQDLLYWKDVPKIQLLHCLANECKGGESMFSDGIRAAVEMHDHNEQHARVLTSVPIPYHYDRGGHLYRELRHVLNESKYRAVFWSPPFQAPYIPGHNLEFQDWLDWHKAAKVFEASISARKNVYRFRMSPGDCVLFDNRRVLHGREPFDATTGKRWLKGAYINNRVFLEKVRLSPRMFNPVRQYRWK